MLFCVFVWAFFFLLNIIIFGESIVICKIELFELLLEKSFLPRQRLKSRKWPSLALVLLRPVSLFVRVFLAVFISQALYGVDKFFVQFSIKWVSCEFFGEGSWPRSQASCISGGRGAPSGLGLPLWPQLWQLLWMRACKKNWYSSLSV